MATIRHRRHANGRRSYNGTTLGTLCGIGIRVQRESQRCQQHAAAVAYSRLSSRPSSGLRWMRQTVFHHMWECHVEPAITMCGRKSLGPEPELGPLRWPDPCRHGILHMIKHITGSTWRQQSGMFDFWHHHATRGHARQSSMKTGPPRDQQHLVTLH